MLQYVWRTSGVVAARTTRAREVWSALKDDARVLPPLALPSTVNIVSDLPKGCLANSALPPSILVFTSLVSLSVVIRGGFTLGQGGTCPQIHLLPHIQK